VTQAGCLDKHDRNWEIWRLRKHDRNWEIWRLRKSGRTFVSIATDFGISTSRAAQITANRERKVKRALKRGLFLGPDTNLRDEILGVEFVFSYEQDVPEGIKSEWFEWPGEDTDEGIHWWVKQEEEQ
jgi:hypothetical protein